MNFSERYFHTGKIALNITEWKNQKINSPNLLLIHGFGVSKKTWDSSTFLLSKNYHLFSVDLRGMGKSGRITPQHSRFDWVTDIYCLINKIYKSPGYLVGHSLGGWICAGVASLNHKKVRAIALGDPFTGVDTIKSSNRKKIKIQEIRTKKSVRTYKELIEYTKILYPNAEGEILEKLILMTFETDTNLELWSINNRSDNSNYEELYKNIKCPTLIIQANPEKGGIMSDREAKRVTSLLENGNLIKWNNSGHSLHIARNHDFSKTIHKFFSSLNYENV